MTSLGTYNTLDGKGQITPFADIILFTESTPSVDRALTATYRVYTCQRQKDLRIAVRKGLLPEMAEHYAQALFGAKKVSPHRGTYWLTEDTEKVAVLVEHRINAAFPPYKRGEALFRRLGWWSHTRLTLKIVRRLKKKGYTVYAGGDLNTPVGVSGYRGVLNEVGRKYDRLGSTKKLVNARRLSRLGSDHFRLRAEVQ